MKTQTRNFKRTALAALSAELPAQGPLAVMSAEITASDDGWYQLLPAGEFSARDGRPHDVPGGKWLMDDLAFRFIQDSYDNRKQPIVVDYNHQTLHKDLTGSEALAAGWIKGDEMVFKPELGLLVRPSLTEKAKAHIAAKEYCYLSAVFHYDADSGRPFELRMVALTNDPGVTGMQALTALSALALQNNPEKSTVNELLLQLFPKLGIALPDGCKEPTKEHYTAALSAVDGLLTAKNQNGELTTKVAALSAQIAQPGAAIDLSKWVPVETFDKVRGELAALSAEHGTMTIDKVLEDARAKGKVIAAEEDYLRQFGGQQGVAALSAMLEKRPAIAALSAKQETEKPGGKTGTAALSAEDREVIRLTGVSEADFIKAREQEQK